MGVKSVMLVMILTLGVPVCCSSNEKDAKKPIAEAGILEVWALLSLFSCPRSAKD